MRSPNSNQVTPSTWWDFLLRRGIFLFVLALGVLECTPFSRIKKEQFIGVDMSGCSTWRPNEIRQECAVLDPNKTTIASVIAAQDYDILYFDVIVSRRYHRAYQRGNHQRIEFGGRVTRNKNNELELVARDDTFVQGQNLDWRTSYPRRLGWVKNVERGQNVTLELDFLRIFFDTKPVEAAHDYGRTQLVEFVLLVEADSHSLLTRLFWIKMAAFVAVLPMLFIVACRSEQGRIPLHHSILLAIMGTALLVFTWPRTEELGHLAPEEYFSDPKRLIQNYAAYLCFETVMGMQALFENLAPKNKLRNCLFPLISIGFVILWYTRYAHIVDFQGSALAYSDGQARVNRQWYFKSYTVKGLYVSSLPCLLISLIGSWAGGKFSPVSGFIAYTMISYTIDRHVLAEFSTWKFARDLFVWMFGYMYLISWATQQSITAKMPPVITRPDLEEEVPISKSIQ